MLQEPFSRPALLGVLDETALNEIGELRGPLFGSNPRRVLIYDAEEGSLGLKLNEGRLSLGQLESENAKTPNVNLGVVLLFTADQLWRHPAHGAHLGVSLVSFVLELNSVAEIPQFDIAVVCDQNVVALDIAVHDVVLV